jgi:cytochrome c oxidase subunit II
MATSTSVVNGALYYIVALSFLLFFLIVFFMVYFLIRYRSSRNPVPTEIPGNWKIEMIWVIVPTLIVMTMFVYGLTGFRFLRATPGDSIPITVHARQWSWLFEYQNGKKSADLIVPVGKDIRCDLVSADVIHGFYVPAFRIQMDTLPGIKTQVWFKATETGSYDILCSQYCGLKHSAMLAKLVVVQPEKFEAWMRGEKIAFPEKSDTDDMVPGERLLFDRGCVSCHSLDGSAMVGPTYKSLFGSRVRVRTNGVLHEVIADEKYLGDSIINPGKDVVDGYSNTMPSGRDLLSDKEISDLIQYLKTLK